MICRHCVVDCDSMCFYFVQTMMHVIAMQKLHSHCHYVAIVCVVQDAVVEPNSVVHSHSYCHYFSASIAHFFVVSVALVDVVHVVAFVHAYNLAQDHLQAMHISHWIVV